LATLGLPRLLDKAGAGHYLSVGVRTVETLMANGKLVPVRLLDRRLLFDRADLDALIETTKASQ
jgi:excisionase family DNA binding protein